MRCKFDENQGCPARVSGVGASRGKDPMNMQLSGVVLVHPDRFSPG